MTKARLRKPRIYLETTMFNYYFDTDRDAHADTVTLFEECAFGRFEPYTSDYVLAELGRDLTEKRGKMLALIDVYKIIVLANTDESDKLALRYTAEGVLPP